MTPGLTTPGLAPVTITGIGSVSPFGPLAGLIPQAPLAPAAITAWTTPGPRRAFLVPHFRPADVVPGLKTRRLDRLSAWALVASSLALKDAGIDLTQLDRSRVAVVFATAFGCVDLTEAFYLSAAANGWNGTDPSTFPETLPSAPASHVSLFHGLRGPNFTVSHKHFAGETALIQAASLLRNGQADLAIVLAGEGLTKSLYSWYEAAGLLSPLCYNSDPLSEVPGFIPSEGVAAFIMESPGFRADSRTDFRKEVRSYARIHAGRSAAGAQTAEIVQAKTAQKKIVQAEHVQTKTIQKIFGDSAPPSLTICAGSGAPCAPSSTAALAREISGDAAVIISPQPVALGLAGTGALFHLILALSNLALSNRALSSPALASPVLTSKPSSGQALLLSTARDNGFAALQLSSP